MIPIPQYFSGSALREKFSLGEFDFWIENSILYCPPLPNLTEQDIADCIYDPVAFNEQIAEQEQAKSSLKDEYNNAVSILEQIRDAESMTQAQAVQAVQYLAKIMLFIVKILARIV